MLLIGFGFSKGWAELALNQPPPLVPRCLIEASAATGPRVIVCCPCAVSGSALASERGGRGRRGERTVERVDRDAAVEGRRHAEPDEGDARHKRDRQHDARDRARQVDVEVAQVSAAAQAADEGHAAGEAGGGRGELRER